LKEAVMFTTSPRLMAADDRKAFNRVEEMVRLSRYGGDCYAYCMLAAGHVDLVIETGLNSFDIMALIPIVQGAGGIVTSWDGGTAKNGGRVLAAGDKRVHHAAMTMLAAKNDG
jgi:myo-inositol-1(or 4)-monophosphatase